MWTENAALWAFPETNENMGALWVTVLGHNPLRWVTSWDTLPCMDLTFPDVIEKWPNAGELARDLSRDTSQNVKRATVKQWKHRQNIPGEYWLPIERAARRRAIENVTVFVLAEIAERRLGATA